MEKSLADVKFLNLLALSTVPSVFSFRKFSEKLIAKPLYRCYYSRIDRGADATTAERAGRRLISLASKSAELFLKALRDGGPTENIRRTVYVSRSAIGSGVCVMPADSILPAFFKGRRTQ